MPYLLVFLLFIAQAALAADDQAVSGQQWLEKADVAMQSSTYQGMVVFLKNGRVDIMKHSHSFENGDEIETLTSLNSPLREITRHGSRVSCTLKDTQQEVEAPRPTDRSLIVNLPINSQVLEDQYLLTTAGQEIVALRPTQVIAVLPKDDLRYARKIWIDTETFLPLRAEVYGLDGTVLEQVMFADLTVSGSSREPAIHAKHVEYHERVKKQAAEKFNQSRFLLEYWPPGFEALFFADKAMLTSKKTVEHLLLSDGFSNLSIYFEAKEPRERGLEGLRTLGAVNSFSRTVGDIHVTVLGEVPARTVELIAKGIVLR
ncbi:MAG: transcriptional regulator [Methylomonas sp.]|nr:MAG: transcriptional regulator [Methylomonas sp.]PPD24919.1 MAG: transcriptional regulator [Methylomonas sp.]PPD33934.1 MAG: transcriptional regulator [Methylomonas sp.]PPD41200.1 MAG: transcriptional regulator [Methylomonas sp.]PPD54785.1 MAG: transcriptional regulator [Methylomonas sp.]